MLFNKARNNFNDDLKFHLCVWDDDNGKPGIRIYYSTEEFKPYLSTDMPGFKRYPITPEIDLVITDTVVYIGWQQVTDDFLNLGMTSVTTISRILLSVFLMYGLIQIPVILRAL